MTVRRFNWNAAILAGLTLLPSTRAFGQLASFPGALGFGATTTGGRGGSVYVVSNLNNSGAGSFRDAVSQPNRIIVFSVGGYEDITSPITASSNLTILGQTAPGGGFGVYGAEVSFYGKSNTIVQYMRFRDTSQDPGGQGTGNSSGNDVNLGNTTNTIFDHDSLEFASYNNVDASGTTGANNLTFQNSIIANPIPDQQFNFHWEGNQGTFINNIFANSHNRSILGKGNVQFVNNSIYNYQAAFTTGNSGGTFNFDIVNNSFVSGPSTTSAGDDFYQVDSFQTAYAVGNMLNGSSDNSTGATVSHTPLLSTTSSLPTLTAAASYAFNVAHSGDSITHDPNTYASSVGYDQVDQLVINNVNSNGSSGRLYGSETDTGLGNSGLGTIANGSSPISTANDGLPDSWKLSHGLNTAVADSTLLNPIGYTVIEQYAAQIADVYNSQTWSAASGSWVTNSGNWSALPGTYDHALIRGNGTTNGAVTISGTNAATAFSLSIGGNGPAAGESVSVSGGSLLVYNTITVGDQNNGSLQITGGNVTANSLQLGNTVWTANGTSSSTYTGTLNLYGGVLTTSVIGLGGGVPGNWTTGGSINWSGGTLAASGSLFVNVPSVLGSGGGILNTNGGTATIAGVISGTGSFLVNGGGTLALTATNTYTGVTTISGATLTVNPLANGGVASLLGASSNASANLVLDGGTLAGAGGTDRLFTLTANGGTLDNSGGVFFSNTGAIALPAANVTLTLTGSNTGHESFSPAIADPGNGFITSILKTGTGKWTFNATNDKTYSGTTNVSSGTLESLATNAFSPDSTIIVATGAYVEMHGYSNVINGLQGGGIVQDSFNHSNDSLTLGYYNGGGTFTGNLGNGDLPYVIKVGTGTQILGGTDTYTGTTTINGGILQFNLAASIGGTGVSVTLNNGATAAAGYAIDQTTFLGRITNGSSGVAALAVNSANNLNFSAAGANLPNVSLGAVGTATYTGTLTPYGTTYRLGGGGGKLILPNNNAATGALNVLATGAGIVDITGTNNYTGITTVSNGAVLDVAVLTNGGVPGGMGQSSNVASNLILDGGTFEGGGSTDRLFTLTTNGGTLDNSAGMIFTNTGSIVLPSANVTLTLTGTNTGHETFSPTLTDPGSGFVTSVVKTGTGKWTFNITGDKTYSGNTNVLSGTLETLASNALSPNSVIMLSQGAALELHDSSQAINGLAGPGTVLNTFVTHNDTLTIGSNNGGGTFTGVINSAATLNLTKTGTGTQILAGPNTYVGNTTIAGGTLKLYGNTPIASYNFATISGGTVSNSGIAGSSMNAVLNGSGGSVSTTGGPLAGTGALTLNGATTSLDVNSPITDLSGSTSWTISLWVKTTQAGATLLSKSDGTDWLTGNSSFYLGTTANGGTGAGGVPDAVRNAGGWAVGSAAVNNGAWHMVTYTDTAGTESVYTDGVLNSETLEGGGFSTADIGTFVRFGFTTDTLDGAANLNGSLSDINVYNTALSQSQIQSLYTTNVAGGNGSNILPSGSAVNLTSSAATLDIESVNQTVASLTGLAGSSVILGGGSVLAVNELTSTEYDGVISGNGSLTVQGGLAFTVGGLNTYTGATNVASGTLTVNGSLASSAITVANGAIFNVNGSLSSSTVLASNGVTNFGNNSSGILTRTFASITIGSKGGVNVANSTAQANRTLIVTSALSLPTNGSNQQGLLDLGSNDMVVRSGALSDLTTDIKQGFNGGNWNGIGGITSTAAAGNISHLTALGVILNTVDGTTTGGPLYGSGTTLGLFDGYSPSAADVLVKYTYYGDANLDGKVDGTDYSRIDSAFGSQLTGWYNGDFNYDGVINGSDYTLIDNAFNTQYGSLSAVIADPTAIITAEVVGASAVPEPSVLSALVVTGAAMLGRRRKRHS